MSTCVQTRFGATSKEEAMGTFKTLVFVRQAAMPFNQFTQLSNFLLVACRDDNSIPVYSRNKDTGLLKNTHQDIVLSHPVCVKFYPE